MILNLTQHTATAEQLAAGVLDLEPTARALLCQQLTFAPREILGTFGSEVIETRARAIVDAHVIPRISAAILERARSISGNVAALNLSRDARQSIACMIGGAPYLMPALQSALHDAGVRVLCAVSERVSVETVVDGAVRKVGEFRHLGFVELK